MTHAFIIDPNSKRQWTRADVDAAALWLSSKAADVEDEVVLSIILDDRALALVWIVAGLLSGCTVNPINPALSAHEVANICKHAQTRLIVTQMAVATTATHLDPELLAPERLAQLKATDQSTTPFHIPGSLLIFTSGTTGRPKGVCLTGAQLQHNVETAVAAFGLHSGAVSASLLPLFHTFTLVSDVLTMLACGGRVVICEAFSLSTLQSTLQAFIAHRVQTFSAVPIILQMLARFGAALRESDLRFAIAGAAPLPDEVRRTYRANLGHPIVPCYGLSETTCFATITPLSEIAAGILIPGTVGKAAGLRLRIIDDHGTTLATGERGEIVVEGPSVIKNGYVGMSAVQWQEHTTADNWFRTGDIGYLDAADYVHITGRKKNMVIRGGEKIYLEDVDREVRELPGVTDCASLAVSGHGTAQDLSIMFVVTTAESGQLADQIRLHILRTLGIKSVSDEVHRVDAIPRSPTGKVQIQALRALWEAGR